ncbi:unnamed protein product [Gadus morhua 'NCC']
MRSAVLYGRCAGITCSRSRQPVSVVTAALPDQRGGQWSVAGSADSSPLPEPPYSRRYPLPLPRDFHKP